MAYKPGSAADRNYKAACAEARRLNYLCRDMGLTHIAKPQSWRDEPHWYIRRSDGSGIFSSSMSQE